MTSLLTKIIDFCSPNNASTNLQWLDDLDKLDDISALQSVTQHLTVESLIQRATEAEQLENLIAIDQKCHARLEKITFQYTRFDHSKPEHDADLFEAVYSYYRQISSAYKRLIRTYIKKYPEKAIFNTLQMPMLLGRALNATFSMIKWRYFNQQSAPTKAWRHANAIYKIAEHESILDFNFQLYENEDEINISAMFVQACMLDTLTRASLNRKQIEITAQLLKKWVPSIEVSEHYLPGNHLFYVDLSSDAGAKRIRQFEPTPDCRYWDMDDMCNKMTDVILRIENNQSIKHFGLNRLASTKLLLEILIKLRSQWSRTEYRRQRRQAKRVKVTKNASVIHGVENICAQVRELSNANLPNHARYIEDGKSLEEHLAAHSISKSGPASFYRGTGGENWMITDESSGGYSVLLGREIKPWVKPGELVCFTFSRNHNEIIIAEIKSVRLQPNGQHGVGLEVLSKKAVWIQMTCLQHRIERQLTPDYVMDYTTPDNIESSAFCGLYLPPENGISKKPSIVIPITEFQPNTSYRINYLDDEATVQLSTSVREQADWARIELVKPLYHPSFIYSLGFQPPPKTLNNSTVDTNAA